MIKRLLKLSFFIIVFFLYSCGARQTSIDSSDITDFGNKLNTEYDTEVGDDMVVYIKGHIYDAIEITSNEVDIKYVGKNLIQKGDILVLISQTKKYNLYHGLEEQKGKFYGVAIPKEGGAEKVFINNEGYGAKFYDPKSNIKYRKTEVPDEKEDYFKQQFIYNGKSGNTIKFTYREYIDNLARPAFTQDLQYDLSESNIIGFKGMRIKVLSAGNTNIKYIILKRFDTQR